MGREFGSYGIYSSDAARHAKATPSVIVDEAPSLVDPLDQWASAPGEVLWFEWQRPAARRFTPKAEAEALRVLREPPHELTVTTTTVGWPTGETVGQPRRKLVDQAQQRNQRARAWGWYPSATLWCYSRYGQPPGGESVPIDAPRD